MLEYAQPPAAVKLVAQWTDWGHIWRQLICKTNEAPEIESYGAHLQVSGPANMPVSLSLPLEVILKESPPALFYGGGLLLASWGHVFLMYSIHLKRVSCKTDEELSSSLFSSPMRARRPVKRETRSHKTFRLYSSTLWLLRALCLFFLTHTYTHYSVCNIMDCIMN